MSRTAPLLRLAAALALVLVLGAILLPAPAGAITGKWGVSKQGYLKNDCAYVVFLRSELDVPLTGVTLWVQFRDAEGNALGTWEVVAETWIQPWTTEPVDWKIPDVCGKVATAKIVKAVATY